MSLLGILYGILIISVIMILHESGHFLMGKALGFKIEEFSIFMGPVLFEREKNGIKFNLKLIPIGASVRFAGEEESIDEESDAKYAADDPGLFNNRPRWRRALVVLMGPLVNFITAIIAFILLFGLGGAVVPKLGGVQANTLIAEAEELSAGDEIISINGYRINSALDASMAEMSADPGSDWVMVYKDHETGEKKTVYLPAKTVEQIVLGISYTEENDNFTVQYVDPDSNSGKPVLVPGDEIIAIEGIPFSDHERISNLIETSESVPLTIEIIRNGERIRVESAPSVISSQMSLGLYLTPSNSFADVIKQSFVYPWSIIRSNIKGFEMIFSGKLALKESLAGPIGIVSMVKDTVQQSKSIGQVLEYGLMLFALISVAIGFFNLLPVPPLDGGHLLFTLIESIKRKPLSDRFKQVVTTVGMIIFLALFVLVLYLDTSKLFGF